MVLVVNADHATLLVNKPVPIETNCIKFTICIRWNTIMQNNVDTIQLLFCVLWQYKLELSLIGKVEFNRVGEMDLR